MKQYWEDQFFVDMHYPTSFCWRYKPLSLSLTYFSMKKVTKKMTSFPSFFCLTSFWLCKTFFFFHLKKNFLSLYYFHDYVFGNVMPSAITIVCGILLYGLLNSIANELSKVCQVWSESARKLNNYLLHYNVSA